MVYGRYNDLIFMGVISWFFSTNVHITGGHHAVVLKPMVTTGGFPISENENLHHISWSKAAPTALRSFITTSNQVL